MSCTNCFNGCTEITSDKCVRYTGADIPALGIQNGDTLQFVEQTLAQFLITTLNGTGIKPIVDLQGVCSVIANNLPVCVGCTGPTLNDLLQALVDSACDLQSLINGVVGNIETLEGPYNEECLTVVDTTFSNTHNVLQAVIDKLCELQIDFDALILTLPSTYVLSSEIQNIIITTLENEGIIGPVTKQYTKMVPYTVIPWFAPASYFTGKFDGTGRGLDAGEFQYIYLCNGVNNTPDMRGRVPAGLTDGGMFGLTMDAAVNPASSLLNPTYSLETKYGNNYVTLQKSEMPVHTHANTIQFNDPGHNHANAPGNAILSDGLPNYLSGYGSNGSTVFNTTGITVGITNVPEGESLAHNNTQPTIGCYYIMYIPV
jgi:microcystin-dependent protein